MADIELVIKIPEEIYKASQILDVKYEDVIQIPLKVIANSTPLPKEHGRLGDLDALEKEMIGGINAGLMIDGYEDYSNINDMDDCLELVKYADTIIEADNEERSEKK